MFIIANKFDFCLDLAVSVFVQLMHGIKWYM